MRRLTFWSRKHPKSRVSLSVLSEQKQLTGKAMENEKSSNENCVKKCFDTAKDERVRVNVEGLLFEIF